MPHDNDDFPRQGPRTRTYRVQVHQGGETYVDQRSQHGSSEKAMVDMRDKIDAGLVKDAIDPDKPYVIEVSRRFEVTPSRVRHLETREKT